ncbi:MAG: formate dehydrogenase accessory protein FdhE [Beijerinckiaceae bacterium]|nr:formate dehydrogenase accessory protein FdhE [Beijerinckiaceae bacterium]
MSTPASLSKPALSAVTRLDALAGTHAEWGPWLSVVREVTAELSDTVWDAHPPHTVAHTGPSPQLAAAVLQPDGPSVKRLLDRLRAVARAQNLVGLAGPASLAPVTSVEEALEVFLAAVNDDDAALDRQAARVGATPEGWRALTQLLPMPYLHACARRWTAGPHTTWSQGFCPVCGAWPAFAEMRGIERARHLRCGRCGAGWRMPVLACTYCGTTDHDALGALVVDDKTARWSVDVCHVCSGYLKSFTTLQPTPSNEILVTDLASVEFDLVALERGFLRPHTHAVALSASLAAAADPEPPPAPKRWWS